MTDTGFKGLMTDIQLDADPLIRFDDEDALNAALEAGDVPEGAICWIPKSDGRLPD